MQLIVTLQGLKESWWGQRQNEEMKASSQQEKEKVRHMFIAEKIPFTLRLFLQTPPPSVLVPKIRKWSCILESKKDLQFNK